MSNDTLLDELQRTFPNAHPADLSDYEQWPTADDCEAEAAARRVARSATPARRVVPSLDSWTLEPCTAGYIELTVTDFGGGYSEATAITRQPDYRPPRPGTKRHAHVRELRSTMSDENLKRSSQRAKKNVRHKIKAMAADRILTLTTRGYLKTEQLAWKALWEFSSLVKRELGRDNWRYVAVPELHKSREHWHLHLAIHGHHSADQMRRLWKLALRRTFNEAVHDHSPGNVDIAYKRKTHAARLNAIARYMSKYITKAADEGFLHKRRYSSTLNIDKPLVHKWFLDLNAASDLAIIRKIQECSNGALSRNPVWEVYAGFDCLVAETEPLPD